MLIGNRNELAMELHPLSPTWERRYLPEQTAWARFSLWVGGRNLCRNLLEGSEVVREGVNVPLAPLADWIVHSWTFLAFEEHPGCFPLRASLWDTLREWGDAFHPAGFSEDEWFDARERWWTRHFLSAGADGAYLPNVSFNHGDGRLLVEWMPAEFVSRQPLRFVSEHGQETVQWSVAEAVIAEFVSVVARWLREEGLDQIFAWVALEDPLRDGEVDFGERLSAYTGVDAKILRAWTRADAESDLRQELGIRPDSADPGGSVVTQVLRDLPPDMPEAVRHEVWELGEEVHRATDFAEELRAVARDAARTGTTPEGAGQLAAQGVRDCLGMDGRAVEDVDEQMRELGVEVTCSEVECSHERMLVGSRKGVGAAVIINRTPRTETRWGRRFESVRALGHLFTDSYREGALGAASTPFAQPWARRRSGAFAAEFLLPSEALLEDAGSLDSAAQPDRFLRILERYGVGARTAAFQLWNQGLLSSPSVRDELIDSFSNVGA